MHVYMMLEVVFALNTLKMRDRAQFHRMSDKILGSSRFYSEQNFGYLKFPAFVLIDCLVSL